MNSLANNIFHARISASWVEVDCEYVTVYSPSPFQFYLTESVSSQVPSPIIDSQE